MLIRKVAVAVGGGTARVEKGCNRRVYISVTGLTWPVEQEQKGKTMRVIVDGQRLLVEVRWGALLQLLTALVQLLRGAVPLLRQAVPLLIQLAALILTFVAAPEIHQLA
jgi:hypothetical protein